MRVTDPSVPIEFVQVGPGLTPAFFQLPELKPAKDWRPDVARTLAHQEKVAFRYACALAGIGQLNEEANLKADLNAARPDALPYPSAAKFEKPHLWRGMSHPDEPCGVWIDPESSIARGVAQYGREIKELLKGKVKA